LSTNAGEARSIPTSVIARNNEESGCFELIGGAVRSRAEKYQAIDLAGCEDRGIASSAASHAATDYRNSLGAIFMEIADGGQDIEVKRRIHGIGIAGPF